MAKTQAKWNPTHHPRDSKGRFTRSATRVMKAVDSKRAKASMQGFAPAQLDLLGDRQAWLQKAAAATPSAEGGAISRYLGGGWKTDNPAMRAGKAVEGVDQLDAAFTELPEDVMLRRVVPAAMFAHIPIGDLVGMKVRDAAPASMSMDHTGPGAPGAVTMHVATPAGTRAYVNDEAGEVLVIRDTEIAITRAVQRDDGQGWDLFGVAIPRADAPARPAKRADDGEGDQTVPQSADAADAPTEGAADGAGDGPAGEVTTAPAEPAPAPTRRRRRAAAAAQQQPAGEDQGAAQQPADEPTTAGTTAPDAAAVDLSTLSTEQLADEYAKAAGMDGGTRDDSAVIRVVAEFERRQDVPAPAGGEPAAAQLPEGVDNLAGYLGQLRAGAGEPDPADAEGVRAFLTARMTFHDEKSGLTATPRPPRINREDTVVRFDITDADGKLVGDAARRFKIDPVTGEPTVKHTHLDMAEDVRGAGFAARFNARNEDLYREQGFKAVTLNANMDVGGYAWARDGYDFTHVAEAQWHAEQAKGDVDSRGPNGDWDDATIAEFQALIDRTSKDGDARVRELTAGGMTNADASRAALDAVPTPLEWAMVGWTPETGRGKAATWPGKELMLRSMWDGQKRLDVPAEGHHDATPDAPAVPAAPEAPAGTDVSAAAVERNAPAAPPALADSVASGVTARRDLNGGASGASVELVTFGDGRQGVHKTAVPVADTISNEPRDAKEQQDAEELGAAIARAFGVRVPDMLRDGDDSAYFEYLPGTTGVDIANDGGPARLKQLAATDDAARMGLADLVMGNHPDRNDSNWMVMPDGSLAGIDHALAFQYVGPEDESDDPADAPAAGPSGNRFAALYLAGDDDTYGEWIDNPLTAADVAEARSRLAALRPEFDRLGHSEWHAAATARLDGIAAHATGTRNLIADGDAPEAGTSAPERPAPRNDAEEYARSLTDAELADTSRQTSTRVRAAIEREREYRASLAGTGAPAAGEDLDAAAIAAKLTPTQRKALRYWGGDRSQRIQSNHMIAAERSLRGSDRRLLSDEGDLWGRTLNDRGRAVLAALDAAEAPATPAADTRAPDAGVPDAGVPSLADSIASGTVGEPTQLGGGNTAAVERVDFNDGTAGIRKTASDMEGRTAKDQQDAEELAVPVLAAFGIDAPEVHRVNDAEVLTRYVPGKTGSQLYLEDVAAGNRDRERELAASKFGRVLGLLDHATSHDDRQSDYIQPEAGGAPVAFDHGHMFHFPPDAPDTPPRLARGVFMGHYMLRNGNTDNPDNLPNEWADNDLTPADIAEARARLQALRPEFDRLDRGDWHDKMMARLDAIGEHAKGTRNLIADEDQGAPDAPAADTNAPELAPTGTPMAELPPADQARIRVAVADHAAGLYASPMIGGSTDNVARYLAEGKLTAVTERHSLRTVWAAVAQALADDPDAIRRSKEDTAAAAEARKADAERLASEAAELMRSGDFDTALARIDAGEQTAPDHLVGSRRDWDDLRGIISKRRDEAAAENAKAAEQVAPAEPAPDAPATPDAPETPATPVADTSAPAAPATPGRAARMKDPEYKRHYNRGWAASKRNAPDALEKADLRHEDNAWYDGWEDYSVGRPKWTTAKENDANDRGRAAGEPAYQLTAYRIDRATGERIEQQPRPEPFYGRERLAMYLSDDANIATRPDEIAADAPGSVQDPDGRYEYEWAPAAAEAPAGDTPAADTSTPDDAPAAAGEDLVDEPAAAAPAGPAGPGELPGDAPSLAAWIAAGGTPSTDEKMQVRDYLLAHLGEFADEKSGLTARPPSRTPVEFDEGAVTLWYGIRDASGEDMGMARRSFQIDQKTGEPAVFHEVMELEPEVQGAGFAARFNARNEAFYRANGITAIRLGANADVGGYAWARAGYDWADMSVGASMAGQLDRRMAEQGWSPADRNAGDALIERANAAITAGDPEAMPTPLEFAMLGWTPDSGNGKAAMWPGKEFMLGQSWSARKRLDTPAEPETPAAGTSTPDAPEAPSWTRATAGRHEARVKVGDREVTITIDKMSDQGYVGKWSVSAIDDGDRIRLDAGDIFPKDTLADAKAEVDRWLHGERERTAQPPTADTGAPDAPLDDAALAQALVDGGLARPGRAGTVTAPPANPAVAQISRPPAPEAPAAPARPALDDREEGSAVSGRLYARTQLDGVAADDARFRMRRARVGNRELDLYDDEGQLLGTMNEQPTGWVTRPASGRAGITADNFPAAVASLRAGEIHPEATPVAGTSAPEAPAAPDAPAAPEAPAAAVEDPNGPQYTTGQTITYKAGSATITGDVEQVHTDANGEHTYDVRITRVDGYDHYRRTAGSLDAGRKQRALSAVVADDTPADVPTPGGLGGLTTRGALGEFDPIDRQRIRLAVEDNAGRLNRTPNMSGASNVARYVAEGRDLTDLTDKHGLAKVTRATRQVIDERPELLTRTDAQIERTKTERAAAAAAAADRAFAAVQAGDRAAALDALDAGERIDPTYRMPDGGPGMDWDEGRQVVRDNTTDPNAPPAAAAPETPAAGTSTPAAPAAAPAEIGPQLGLDGSETEFVPQDRGTIGMGARADVGRDRAMAAVQQMGLFASDEREMEGQGALLDALLAMPAADPPPAMLPEATPAPEALDDPRGELAARVAAADLSGWSDEQLSGAFLDLSSTDELTPDEEAGLQAIGDEWERREADMATAAAAVPADLAAVSDDDLAQLFVDLTAGDGTMDEAAVARLEAELDRRDAERVAALADLEAKRALVARPPAEHAGDAELEAAMNAATDLQDWDAFEAITAEWSAREDAQNARQEAARQEAARVEAEARQTAVREAEAAAYAEQGRRAEAERVATHNGMTAARAAAIVPDIGKLGYIEQAQQVLGGEDGTRAVLGDRYDEIITPALDAMPQWQRERDEMVRRVKLETLGNQLTADEKARLVYAAADTEAAAEFAGMSDEDLDLQIRRTMFGQTSNYGGEFGKTLDRKMALGREKARRRVVELRQQEEGAFLDFRRRALEAPVADLTDVELTAAPVVVTDVTPAGTARLEAIAAEATRRQNAADDRAARKAAGPAGPARVANPVSELGSIEQMADSYARTTGWRGNGTDARSGREANHRLWEARAMAVGLPADADEKAIKAAEKNDPRGLPDRSAMVLAWYRHLGQFADLGDNPSDWQTGPADVADLPDVLPTLPGAKVSKPADVWEAIKQQAIADRAAGDQTTARRYIMAYARTYGVPFNRQAETEDEMRAIQSAYAGAARSDPRTAIQQSASLIAEFRRLAAEDGVDPDDTYRYGPPDKQAAAKSSRTTWATATADQQIRINALVAQGWDELEAVAEVLKLSADDLRREQNASAVLGGAKPTAKVLKQHYEEYVHRQWKAAEDATAGHLLNKAGEAKTLDPRSNFTAVSLFSGPEKDAYKYASEELMRWWGENPRLSFAEFKAQLVGDGKASRDRVAQGAKGNEFA